MPYALAVLFLAIGLWLFLRPLRAGGGGISGDSLADISLDVLKGGPSRNSRQAAMKFVFLLGCTSVLLPPLLPLATAFIPSDARRGTIIALGFTIAGLSIPTFFLFILAGMSFGFGQSKLKPATLAGRAAPAFPFLSGLAFAGIAIARPDAFA